MNTFDLPSNSNYGDQPIPITFPENWDVHISKIHGYDTPALTEAQIAEKIHAAIGAKPISEGAAGKRSAVIIIDDITRPTPCEPIAKAVIAELLAAGVPKENIWFIIALGTHGVMYRTEFVRKLGEEIVENYEVHNHNLFFNHVFVGNTSNNVPVEINADVMSADYKIAIGTTMAHSYYGFSGGAKSFGGKPCDIRRFFHLIWECSRRLANVIVENKDFEEVIRQYDRAGAVIYCDPPYYKAESCYEVEFPPEDHQRLHDVLVTCEGYFIVSYNYQDYICEIYQDCYIFRTSRPKSMSQTAGSEYEEIVITNYDPRKACWQLSMDSLLGGDGDTRYELIHEPEHPLKI